MIELKDAIKSAILFSSELSESLGKRLVPSKAPRLEGVEQDESARNWVVTLSFLDEDPDNAAPAQYFLSREPRTYRQFSIDGATGEVKSMKHVAP